MGSLHPRKNIDGLLKAFQHYVDAGGGWNLVLVGVAMWSDDLPSLPDEVQRRVHFAGRLNHGDLVAAVAGAQGLVFVPWFEGFGIPLVEAMSCGVPVVASNVTSLPEVCGDAAFALVDPGQPEDISKAMLDLEGHPEAASEAAERGLRRAQDFSWRATGQALSDALNDMMSRR